VTLQNICDSPAPEWFASGVDKELGRCDRTADGQPGAKCCRRCLPERQRPFAAAFTTDADTGDWSATSSTRKPVNSETRRPAHTAVQHSPIPDSRQWKDYKHENKQNSKVTTVDADEFIRRFLIHTLPPGFQRVRHLGLLANCHRTAKLTLCRELLIVPVTELLPQPTDCRQLLEAITAGKTN